MNIAVRLFASCADIIGANQTTVSIDGVPTVREVRNALEHMFGHSLISRSMIAVNAVYADDTVKIHNDDEVALIPPVAGG